MNCLKCELRRAKWRAAIMTGLGKDLYTIAKHLTETYGENYYVTKLDKEKTVKFTIWRANKLPNYVAHEVYSLEGKK